MKVVSQEIVTDWTFLSGVPGGRTPSFWEGVRLQKWGLRLSDLEFSVLWQEMLGFAVNREENFRFAPPPLPGREQLFGHCGSYRFSICTPPPPVVTCFSRRTPTFKIVGAPLQNIVVLLHNLLQVVYCSTGCSLLHRILQPDAAAIYWPQAWYDFMLWNEHVRPMQDFLRASYFGKLWVSEKMIRMLK